VRVLGELRAEIGRECLRRQFLMRIVFVGESWQGSSARSQREALLEGSKAALKPSELLLLRIASSDSPLVSAIY
jgi:hypothetical protein